MADRSPAFIREWLKVSSYKMDGPAQYLGDEPGSVRKDWESASVRWLMAASWPYEHAAGNQSTPAVYRAINDGRDDFLCDRFYLPQTPRDLRAFERGGIPVFGIESKHQLRDFDIAATSISYAVLFMNFCKMLSLSDVPLRWRDREAQGLEQFPMVMVGGQAFCAPGFMEPVVDCVWLGEVEDEPGNGGISQVNARVAQFKELGLWQSDRLECYKRLAREFNYLYFPRFVGLEYGYEDRELEHPSKQVIGYRSLLPGMRMPFEARKVRDMDQIKPLTEAPLIYANPAMGLGDLEVARGCPAWCSFCRLTYVQKPYRQRSVGKTVEHATAWRDNMGSVELSPFSPDFPMHTQKNLLLSRLLSEVGDEVDTTAMRVDDFIADPGYIMLQAVGGADAVTLGLEGNSQRMRDLVGKGTSDKDVEEAVARGIRAGFRKFKLFMITNFPGEEPADVMRIVRLGRRLADIRDQFGEAAQHVIIQFSWTPLLIEAATPFQWFAPTAPDHTLIDVADHFRDLKIAFKIGTKAEPNKIAFFQLCQRASRAVGEAIIDVIEDLGTACWGGVPRDMRDRLEAALLAHGFANGYGDCFDERYKDDLFGWDFISTGVSAELLWVTYQQMVEFLEGTDAETYDRGYDETYHGNEWIARCDTSCMGKACGACSPADLKLRTRYIRGAQQELHVDLAKVRPIDQTTVAFKIRARVTRKPEFAYVSADHYRASIRRAAYRAQRTCRPILPEGCGIAKRSIRFASDALKSRDWVYGVDYVEFAMTRKMTFPVTEEFIAAMRAELGEWLELGEFDVLDASAGLRAEAGYSLWELEVNDSEEAVAGRLRAWQDAATVPMTIKLDSSYFGVPSEEVDAKEYVDGLWAVRDGHRLLLRMLVRGKAGPYGVYQVLMGKGSRLDGMVHTAHRLDFFTGTDSVQGDLLRPACTECGTVIPASLLDEPYHPDYCPRCLDESRGAVAAGLPAPSAV